VLPFLWLIPAFPLAGFLILALSGNRRLPHAFTSLVGVGSVGLSALLAVLLGAEFSSPRRRDRLTRRRSGPGSRRAA